MTEPTVADVRERLESEYEVEDITDECLHYDPLAQFDVRGVAHQDDLTTAVEHVWDETFAVNRVDGTDDSWYIVTL